LALSAAIAEELARRYSYTDIDTYLDEFGLNTPHQSDDETEKSGYVKKRFAELMPLFLSK
jgi:hypothetical protein